MRQQLTTLSALSDIPGLTALPDVTVTLAPEVEVPTEGLEGPDGSVPLVGYLVLAPAGTQLNDLLALPFADRRGHGERDEDAGQAGAGTDLVGTAPGTGAGTGVRGQDDQPGQRRERRHLTEAVPDKGLDIDLDKRTVTVDGASLRLTYLEFELLAHLVRHPHRVYTREQLVATIWGYGPVGDQRTVDVHIARLRRKLGAAYRERIVTIRRVGYKYVPARASR
ncbi:winged helix-turn-helix domain-containing protein [Streptomyces sp. 6N223]|uniref:winged helix-turn-helix domain-containing protein n=1 Tax=Streptomyces sp. 6N223 TaxID=3457412 RepID=UPI003FD3F0AB